MSNRTPELTQTGLFSQMRDALREGDVAGAIALGDHYMEKGLPSGTEERRSQLERAAADLYQCAIYGEDTLLTNGDAEVSNGTEATEPTASMYARLDEENLQNLLDLPVESRMEAAERMLGRRPTLLEQFKLGLTERFMQKPTPEED